MLAFLKELLGTDHLSPHGICLTWRPELIWTNAVSDAVIGLAYFSIPAVLAVFVSKRRDVAFGWVFWFFAAFILACGTTHFMSIWTLWVPDYGLEGLIKAFTAVVSLGTAVALWPLLPKALALPSPEQLRRANEALEARVAERDRAMAALAEAHIEREKVEDMLRQSQKMEAIGQFSGGMAHDFNNLLGIIIANLDRLDRRLPAEDPNHRSVLDALDASGRAATLVQKLLAFSRKQPLLPTRVDLNVLVEDMMPLLGGVLQTCQIVLDLRASGAVHVDANQLENGLLNLAVNARDAMPEGGVVTLRTRHQIVESGSLDALPAGAYVVLEVEDNGRGMPPSVTEHAFEPFFTTKPVGLGTGLGLSQVFGFVTQSGGTVRLWSREGLGTRVTLYLPRADPALETTAATVEHAVSVPGAA